MDKVALQDLVRVTRAQLLEQQRRSKPGLDAIKRLRAQRRMLDELDRSSLRSADAHHLRATGADVLWRAWLDRQRRDINTQLARSLAAQDHVLRALRIAQGRHDVLTTLLKKAEGAEKRRQADHQFAGLQDASLLRRRKRT